MLSRWFCAWISVVPFFIRTDSSLNGPEGVESHRPVATSPIPPSLLASVDSLVDDGYKSKWNLLPVNVTEDVEMSPMEEQLQTGSLLARQRQCSPGYVLTCAGSRPCCQIGYPVCCGNGCCPSGYTCPAAGSTKCCPVGTGWCSSARACCPFGYNCPAPGSTQCCRSGTGWCAESGQCCPLDTTCPTVGSYVCCPLGSFSCGSNCCSRGTSCCGTECCNSGESCCGGSRCCAAGTQCQSGQCVSPTTSTTSSPSDEPEIEFDLEPGDEAIEYEPADAWNSTGGSCNGTKATTQVGAKITFKFYGSSFSFKFVPTTDGIKYTVEWDGLAAETHYTDPSLVSGCQYNETLPRSLASQQHQVTITYLGVQIPTLKRDVPRLEFGGLRYNGRATSSSPLTGNGLRPKATLIALVFISVGSMLVLLL